ncbi:Rcs stress response system protein RcsF [Erwinia persicina]|uniref:Rcs stress response system protein RcsF n=1 Tax=Erwinia persicina TaxID=55211 RepID=UPI001782A5F8|nr:Rcs stress response system protein RcsF [Erwinia persicina]MBD8162432.1 Rcs stress response system protein RcsF [Erwinia persicina]
MRKLAFILVSLALTGCAHTADQNDQKKSQSKPEAKSTMSVVTSHTPVKLLSHPDELAGKPFLALGRVTGSACQTRAADFPTDMNIVRHQLQTKAATLHANAVLLNNCEITASIEGCYRQTLCQGSALRVAQ